LYAILRSIPNKLGGVIALATALVILILPPFTFTSNKIGSRFNPSSQILFWFIVASWLILTWIGARPVEEPYVLIGQIATIMYFSYFLIIPVSSILWDDLVKPKKP
jgi:ubiquinol-cytochrome c reductase cytochrome b subunit